MTRRGSAGTSRTAAFQALGRLLVGAACRRARAGRGSRSRTRTRGTCASATGRGRSSPPAALAPPCRRSASGCGSPCACTRRTRAASSFPTCGSRVLGHLDQAHVRLLRLGLALEDVHQQRSDPGRDKPPPRRRCHQMQASASSPEFLGSMMEPLGSSSRRVRRRGGNARIGPHPARRAAVTPGRAGDRRDSSGSSPGGPGALAVIGWARGSPGT